MAEPPLHGGVDDIQAHPPRTGHRWVDMAVAACAITISIISLIVAVQNGETGRKMVAASSWPFLVYDPTINGLPPDPRTINLRVENSGVGPARIQSVVVRLDGRPVRSFRDLLSKCCAMSVTDTRGMVQLGLVTENPIVGVLPARDGVDFLALRERPGNAALFEAFNAARGRLGFSVCYCSVLDECWRTDLKSITAPTRVGQCRPRADGYVG